MKQQCTHTLEWRHVHWRFKHMVTSKPQLLLQVCCWCLVRLRGGRWYVGRGGWIFLEGYITAFFCKIRLLSTIWLAPGKDTSWLILRQFFKAIDVLCVILMLGCLIRNSLSKMGGKTLFRNMLILSSRPVTVSCLSPRLWCNYSVSPIFISYFSPYLSVTFPIFISYFPQYLSVTFPIFIS